MLKSQFFSEILESIQQTVDIIIIIIIKDISVLQILQSVFLLEMWHLST